MRWCVVMLLLCLSGTSWVMGVLLVPKSPWTVGNEHREQTHVLAPFEFRLDDGPLDDSKWSQAWKCSDINALGANYGCKVCSRSVPRAATCPMCFSSSRCRMSSVWP